MAASLHVGSDCESEPSTPENPGEQKNLSERLYPPRLECSTWQAFQFFPGTLPETPKERPGRRRPDILNSEMESEEKQSHPNPSSLEPDNDQNLDLYEANTHPFVIKIWLEVAAGDTAPAVWRGHITHVPSNRRQYVQDLKEVVEFIAHYLKQMGVDVNFPWSTPHA